MERQANEGKALRKRQVLVVDPDPLERARIEASLEAVGFALLDCPGPRLIDWICPGEHGLRCPLIELADAAVVDVRVLGEVFDTNSRGRRLLHHYFSSGKPVILLNGTGPAGNSFHDEQIKVMHSRKPAAIVQAVGEATRQPAN